MANLTLSEPVQVWVDPKSKLPLRMEQSISFKNEQIKWMIYDMEFDQSFDPSLFSFTPPEGYSVEIRDWPTLLEEGQRPPVHDPVEAVH